MDWLTQYADPNLDWGYALITLMVRFIGVFLVMFVMQVALQGVAWGVRKVEGRGAGEPTGGPGPLSGNQDGGVDDATVAVIGVALALERPPTPAGMRGRASAWGMAGRMAQLDRMPARRR